MGLPICFWGNNNKNLLGCAWVLELLRKREEKRLDIVGQSSEIDDSCQNVIFSCLIDTDACGNNVLFKRIYWQNILIVNFLIVRFCLGSGFKIIEWPKEIPKILLRQRYLFYFVWCCFVCFLLIWWLSLRIKTFLRGFDFALRIMGLGIEDLSPKIWMGQLRAFRMNRYDLRVMTRTVLKMSCRVMFMQYIGYNMLI